MDVYTVGTRTILRAELVLFLKGGVIVSNQFWKNEVWGNERSQSRVWHVVGMHSMVQVCEVKG